MSDQEQIEGLHQRAAENYLQGQFEEALHSWRELLQLDPQDERATEGIRLCELIVQQSSGEEFDSFEAEPAPVTLGPGEGSDVDFEEIETLLETALPEVATADDPGWDFSALEAESGGGGGLDLADLPDLEPEPSAAEPASAFGDFEIPALDMDQPGGASAAAAEVESRIAELLSQASTSFDAGDVEGAMTLLDRVLLLDETNAAASALAEAFKSEVDARNDPKAGEGPAPDAVADDGLQSLGLADPAGATPSALHDPSLVDTPPEVAADDLLDGMPALEPPAALEDEAGAVPDRADPMEETADAAVAPVGGKSSPAGSRKRLLVAAVGVLALAAAGFFGFRLTGRGEVTPAIPEQAVPVATPTQATPAEPATTEDVQTAEVAEPVVAPEPVEDLNSVMSRARAAFDAGEFSQAVVAFNEALKIAPANRSAQRGLAASAAAYQEQRNFRAKLDAASAAFGRGEYSASLRIFYRLPGTDGVARFDRFKANGWYNLAVGALKSGACSDARSHLEEASTLVPGDAGITSAAKLARACRSSQSDPLWQDDVERLTTRRLGD